MSGNGLNGEPRNSRGEGRSRPSKQVKNGQSLAGSLENDLNYHNALNEHVRSAYPNINSLSTDMLRDLSIPTEILGRPAVPRAKREEKKGGSKSGK